MIGRPTFTSKNIPAILSCIFGYLQLRYPIKRRIQQAVIILDEHQIINVDDVRLMNLDKPGKAMHNLLGRHAPTQSQRWLVVQNHFPQLTF